MFPVNISVPYVDNLEQRGYADMIEKLVAEEAMKNSPRQFYKARSKRSIEDFSYQTNGQQTWFDVKSFDVGSDFSMPNLVSIDRLRKVMADDSQDLIYILVEYKLDHDAKKVSIEKIEFRPVYTIDTSVLAIQNLGKGVLQIKNMHNSLDRYTGSKEDWMKEISAMAYKFYDKQIVKFKKLQGTWA
jgi:hypothetical protein